MINESWLEQNTNLISINEIWCDIEELKCEKIYFLVQFSSPFCKYFNPEVTVIQDQVLINVDVYITTLRLLLLSR